MKKHAYLIMAHNEFHMLKKLIHELDDERNDLYIHIDRKTRMVDENVISSWAERSSVFFIPRKKIFWGTLSIVECEIALFEAALKGHYHYYHLISGMDFPLKDQDYIHEKLADDNYEYISYHLDGYNEDHFMYKVKYYYPLLRIVGKGFWDGPGRKKLLMRWLVRQQWNLQVLQEKLGIDRTQKYKGIIFYKGDQWVSVTHDFAEYVVSQKKKILKMYRLTNGADEFVFATLAMNSDYADRVKNDSLRMIDWDRGSPYEFDENDLDELVSSDAFFARKISYNDHPALVNGLISHLHRNALSLDKNDNPLISIIVPCYNVESFVKECIDSLLAQTYSNIEILLIDDGSTDKTGSIAKDYANRYDNVIYYHKCNGGLSSARNVGIDISKGKYIAFVDSDDWVDEQYIENLFCALRDNNVDIAVCGFCKEDKKGHDFSFQCSTVISSHTAMKALADIYPKENSLLVIACNKLFKKELFNDICFSEGRIHEDELIAHRIIDSVDAIALIDDVLYHYRMRLNSITGGFCYQGLEHMDYLYALQDRVEYSNNMMYGDLRKYYLYTGYEGIRQLMASYTDDSYKENRLRSVFRKKALRDYIRFFFELNRSQRMNYLFLVLFPDKVRRNAILERNAGNNALSR